MYTNADQFLNKKEDLLEFIAGNEPSVVMITEVIPKAQINPIEASALNIDGYDVYVNFDISKHNLGACGIRGVAIYVKDELNASEVTFCAEFKDHIWVEIPLTEKHTLLCGCIYRSPTKEKDVTLKSTKQLCDLLVKAGERNDTHLLICGDFNYRGIDWVNESAVDQSEHLATFINTVQDCFLHQHVTEPTRFRLGEEPSLLDLVLSKEEGMVYNLAYQPGLGDSDHVSLTFDLICHTNRSRNTQPQPNYFKANYANIRKKLGNINWEDTLFGNFEERYVHFAKTLTASIEGNVPKRTHTIKRHNIYMNRDAIRLKNKKQKLWKKYASSRGTSDYVNFVKCKNHLRSFTRSLRKDFEKTLASKSKTSPKPFWSYVKSKMKSRIKVPTLIKSDGTKAYHPREKADALNNFFGSVYKEELDNVPHVDDYSGIPLASIIITHEMVMEKLNSLNPGKSTGPDGWHPYFLYSLADILCTPLTILFNTSLREGIVPPQWLEACITAIHKKGLKSVVGNYRPVSITSVICKMMESIVRDYIVMHMSSNRIFADEQHGFVPNRECMTNLLLAMEEWTEAMESGYDIDIIYTDFAKAFDSVPHKRLAVKLKSLGINGEVLRWIEAFLSGRRHRVSIDGELSDWVYVKSGIPQGSVLGPILFVVFINDMPRVINNCCKLFADDAKIYSAIHSEDDTVSLQNDINSLVEWSTLWQLPFNIEKCKCMHVGRKSTAHSYQMNDHILENVNEEKDLGVIIDNRLKFHTHTSAAIKKANSILGLIKRSFATLDEDILPLLFTSMVRPHLEYGNIIWGPHFVGDIKAVERVQKRATRMIPSLKNLSYRKRLEILNLPSLSYRRKRGSMIMIFKIMTKKLNISLDHFFSLSNFKTRGHVYKILKNQRATKQVRCHSFSIRSVSDWNRLPSDVVLAESVNQFKNKLDEHWKATKFDSLFK